MNYCQWYHTNPFFNSIDTSEFTTNNRLQYGMNIGSGFSAVSSNNSFSTMYYNPYFTYKATSKLYIKTSFLTINQSTNGLKVMPTANGNLNPGQSQSVVIRTSALYKLNNKVNIYATLYGQTGNSGKYDYKPGIYPSGSIAENGRGGALGLEYQISDRVKFSGAFQYQEGFRYNPYQTYYSDLYNPLFSPLFP